MLNAQPPNLPLLNVLSGQMVQSEPPQSHIQFHCIQGDQVKPLNFHQEPGRGAGTQGGINLTHPEQRN